MREVAWLIRQHWTNIVTYFSHRITNAVSEGLNSKIQTIKKMAYGFRNKAHFKTAIWRTRSVPTLIPEEPKIV